MHNLLMLFFNPDSSKIEVTSQRLLDQSQAGVYIRENATHIRPNLAILGLFAYRTPKGLNC